MGGLQYIKRMRKRTIEHMCHLFNTYDAIYSVVMVVYVLELINSGGNPSFTVL